MKKKQITRLLSVMLAAALSVAPLTGCGSESAGNTNVAAETIELSGLEGMKSSEVAVDMTTANSSSIEILDFVKGNFAASSLNEQYNEPLYHLPADYVFEFECSDEAGYIAYDAFRVYDNPDLKDITGKTYNKNTYEDGKITIAPYGALTLDENGYMEDDGTWGSLNQLYLVQHLDLETGKELEHPIVTPFSIQHDLNAPAVTQGMDENNSYVLSWNAVPGATKYRVYEYFGDVAYQVECVTSNTSVSVEEFTSQKETEELLELFMQDLENAGYSENVTNTDGIFYMNSALRYDDSRKNGYFVVVAADDEGRQSGISNIMDVRELANRLPYNVVNSPLKVQVASIEDVPAYVEVEMVDGSINTMIIDYHGAQAYRDPDNDNKMTIQAHVANTLFNKFVIVLEGMDYDDILAQISYVTEREDELLSRVGGAQSPDINITNTDSEDVTKVMEDMPQESEEPKPSEEPASSEEPKPSEESVSSEEPKPGEEPASSEEPKPGEEPASNEEPKPGEESPSKPDESETEASVPVQVMNEVAGYVQQQVTKLGTEKVENVLYGSNDLGAWMGLCLIAQSEIIPAPVEVFPDAANVDYAATLLMEAYRQNPTSGLLGNVGYSNEHQAFVVEYVEEREVRLEKAAQELEAAEKIAAEVITDDMSDYEKVLAINEYFRTNASYDFDSTATDIEDFSTLSEQFIDSHTPYGIICKNYGVCESYSEAFILTARCAGPEAMCEIGALYGGGHEWNRVKVDGNWCVLDVTNNDVEILINGLFNVTDEQIKGILVPNHSAFMNAEAYAAEDATNEYYYVNDMSVEDMEDAADVLEEQLKDSEIAMVRVPVGATEADYEAVIKELVKERGIHLSNAGAQFNILFVEK